jgi:NAD+ kinase
MAKIQETMKVAVYGKKFSDDSRDYIEELFRELKIQGFQAIVCEELMEHAVHQKAVFDPWPVYKTHEDVRDFAQVFIAVGGDGTILDATTIIRDSGIPVLGINIGRLGFLATCGKFEIKTALQNLKSGNFKTFPRSVLQLSSPKGLFGELNFALNELTVNRTETTAMITIHVYLNDRFLNTYWSDGLIVSTPTGSTGYNLSCGGPIIMPGSDNFVITPIAPHTLTVRPFVFSDKNKVKIKVEGRSDTFLVSLDSRVEHIGAGDELVIERAPFAINLVYFDHNDYARTLRNKLMWGLDRRN